MPVYNKLVRDLIPDIIAASGKSMETRILSNEEYVIEVKKKMKEELAEYHATQNDEDAIEELADLLELISAAAKTHGVTLEEVEAAREVKARDRGRFNEKIYLVEVED
ncbi:nucleoside triphosphate pyrophosphohydrolase [Jeotgalibacillus haloalkalitolerans]|uniref:Nucleoside triphosphate pyrophosphohydrolase n=1 Tax=Jeotgalibacillus haloalkalitolerans TaxID=3104292 RepID=A0ABU5KJV7_9BACL|nr:nucleoside triphosphate pyrophosphohydrolase [Jeotgalibacillus sp. HH7-29]MDZ5711000.1 nucleoside triphosphate pyrophosphohydrolase [Jeotgalibacillus sp. HH7-29]